MTEEGFRTKFRACKPERGESLIEFVARLSHYFSRWVELSNIDQTYDSLANLILKEQFLNICNQEIVVHLKEKKLATIEVMQSRDTRRPCHHFGRINKVSKS